MAITGSWISNKDEGNYTFNTVVCFVFTTISLVLTLKKKKKKKKK